MAPATTMIKTTLIPRNTSTTSTANTFIVIFVLVAAFCIGSMCHGLYARKTPFSNYFLTSLNPMVLLFMWPFRLLNFVCWGISKVRGKQIKVPDAEMQQNPQRSAIMQPMHLNRDLAEAFDIEQTPTPSLTHLIWNRLVYVPVVRLSSSSSSWESQAVRPVYNSVSQFISLEAYTYNDRLSTSRCVPPHAYDFPTSSPYTASERNVVGGENTAYFEASPANCQIITAAFANAKEVKCVRMKVDKIEAERVRKEVNEISVVSVSSSATETPDAQKTSIEDLSHIRTRSPSTERLFSVDIGRPDFVHPVLRPASVAGFILQCSDDSSIEGEEEEGLEHTQAEAEAAQRFQHHAHLQELKEARFQADIEAAVADLRKQLDTNTAFAAVGTVSETSFTASSNSSSSSEFLFRSGSAPTFAAAPRDWEAEEVEAQALLDPVRTSVAEMFKVLPVQRPKGWKGASLVPAESLSKITTDFGFEFGPGIDPGPNGFGALVESPEYYTFGEKEAVGRKLVDVSATTLENELNTQSIRQSVVRMFQTTPIQHFKGAKGISLDSQESLPEITMDVDTDFRCGPSSASPATYDLGNVSETSLLDLASFIELTPHLGSASDFADACREWEAEEALSAAVVGVFQTSDSEGEDEASPYSQLASKTNTSSANAYPSVDTASEDPLVEALLPSVDDFLSSIGDVFDTLPTPKTPSLSSASSDLVDAYRAWKAETELRESITDMFANDPIQHHQGQGASMASASPASSSSFETYPGGKPSRTASEGSFCNISEDAFGDFSDVCVAAEFPPQNTTTAETNELCEPPEGEEAGDEDAPAEFELDEDILLVSSTEEPNSTPAKPATPVQQLFLAAALPFFHSQHTPQKPKLLKGKLQRQELHANADRVPSRQFVPDWKFEKDMAR